MLDAFEVRLADLLADELVGVANLGPIGRSGAVAAAAVGAVGIAVRIARARPTAEVGDDQRERLGARGEIRLRPRLHLEGDAVLALRAVAPAGAAAGTARQRLLSVLDAVLLALHGEAVRTGRAFQLPPQDLGFDLDGFRLASFDPLPGEANDPLSADLVYRYSGRFWPVEEPVAGDVIASLPTRMAVMPVQVPERIVARAAGGDIAVPIRVDLRAMRGAPASLAARLAGAAPPGSLVGDPAVIVPPGFVGFPAAPDGAFRLVYRPPQQLATRTDVRVQTRLAHADRPSIGLADFVIEVLPA